MIETKVHLGDSMNALGPGRAVALFATALYLAGCSNPFSNADCVAIGVAGIEATIVDASTDRAPTATPTLRIEEGTYVELHDTPSISSNPPIFTGAVERPGIYRVIASAPGYKDSVRDNIVVSRSGRCGYLKSERFTLSLPRSM